MLLNSIEGFPNKWIVALWEGLVTLREVYLIKMKNNAVIPSKPILSQICRGYYEKKMAEGK